MLKAHTHTESERMVDKDRHWHNNNNIQKETRRKDILKWKKERKRLFSIWRHTVLTEQRFLIFDFHSSSLMIIISWRFFHTFIHFSVRIWFLGVIFIIILEQHFLSTFFSALQDISVAVVAAVVVFNLIIIRFSFPHSVIKIC